DRGNARARPAAQPRYGSDRRGGADAAGRHAGAHFHGHDWRGAGGDLAPGRVVAGGPGVAAVGPRADLWRRRLTGGDRGPDAVWNPVLDPLRDLTGELRGRTVCRSRQPQTWTRLT